MRTYRGKLAIIALIACGGMAMAEDYDDIYYNPKKDTSTTTRISNLSTSNSRQSVTPVTKTRTVSNSTYISNMADMDVDAYNRRGEQYYVSSIDTIGNGVENGEDFIYTQQIQKYYNPTIVVDNANVLGDVLTNAYGNVDIIINDAGYPVFGNWYGWNWPYYTTAWSPWYWGVNIGPLSWSIGWNYPYYSWAWGPSWGWGPGWWNPGPSWGWGPGWGPAWRPGPPGPGPRPLATWSPRGNRTVGPRPGWSAATRPAPSPGGGMAPGRNPAPGSNRNPAGGNYRGGNGSPSIGSRPGAVHTGNRPAGVINNGGRWQYNNNAPATGVTNGNNGHRTPGSGVITTRPSTTPSNGAQHRTTTGRTTTNSNKSTTVNNRTTTNTQKSVSNNRSTSTNRSTGVSRSTGGGGRSTGGRGGGGGGGRHR